MIINCIKCKTKLTGKYSNRSKFCSINRIKTDAKIEDGGGGAFYIFLKKNKK